MELLQGRLAWLEAAGAEDDTSDPAVLRARLQAQAARIQELEARPVAASLHAFIGFCDACGAG